MELFDLPLYAVQRLADGTWLVRTLMGDPILPAVDVVAVLDEPAPCPARVLAAPFAGAHHTVHSEADTLT